MSGILYGVGVGPGDPELMTLKACRLIRENEVIAVPGKTKEESLAYRIACRAVPEICAKQIVPLLFPMTKDRDELKKSHRDAARKLEEFLRKGKNAVFLTLGDVSVYSTFFYIQRIVETDGYEARMVSGVPSFCAAAAALGEPLAAGDGSIHIIPSADAGDDTYVFMKSGRKMKDIKKFLSEKNMQAGMVRDCGMPDEKIYRKCEDFPDEAGYFSIVVAKKSHSDPF